MNFGNGATRRPAAPRAALAGALLAGCLFAGVAGALPEDRSQPIRVTADSAVQQAGTVTYKGAVVIVQGTLKIEADRVTVDHVDGRVQKMTAIGQPARLQQQPEPGGGLVRARAETIIYFQSENRAELLRSAQVERDGSTVNGDRIEYQIDSETVRAQGGQQGGGRVEMVLQPERPADAAPAPSDDGETR